MDHLPYPSEARRAPLTIPCLFDDTIESYDDAGFAEFPIRVGWQTGDKRWFECEDSVAAARAQAWLWFGLIRETMGPTVESSNIISHNSDGTSILNTKSLFKSPSPQRLVVKPHWRLLHGVMAVGGTLVGMILSIGLLSLVDEARYAPYLSLTSRRTKYVIQTLQLAELEMRKLETHHFQSEAVGLSCVAIRALLWSLRNTIADSDARVLTRNCVELSNSPYMIQLLKDHGFCPQRLTSLARWCSVVTLHYLLADLEANRLHEECSVKKCMAHHIYDESCYVPRHVENECTCEDIQIDTAEISSIISDGGIPIIVASLNNGSLIFTVRRMSRQVPYVAISHSWSGGLGNPRDNTLPGCQIRWIVQQILNSSSSATSANFWIDTLCIPPWSAMSERIRILAVGRMDLVYASAQTVLVVDPDLRLLNRSTSPSKFTASVSDSAWMTRCWTYLEARLAPNLQVAIDGHSRDYFEQCFAVASKVTWWSWNLCSWNDQLQIDRELAAGLYTVIPFKDVTVDTAGPLSEHFVQCWNSLAARNTSRASDQLIILALMLDFSIAELQQVQPSDLKLPAMLKRQARLPLSILLEQQSPDCLLPSAIADDWVPRQIQSFATWEYGSLVRAENRLTGKKGYLLDIEQGLIKGFKLRLLNLPAQMFNIRFQSNSSRSYSFSIVLDPSIHNGDHDDTDVADPPHHSKILFLAKPQSISRHGDFLTGIHVGTSGQGFLMDCVGDGTNSLLLANPQPISFHLLDTGDVISGDEQMSLVTVDPLDDNVQLEFDTDWSQWPTLNFNRAADAKFSTSREMPIHIYGTIIFFLEVSLFMVAASMVIMVFPTLDSLANGFWSKKTSPGEWTAWALTILAVLLRLILVIHVELPALNSELGTAEYHRWTASLPYDSHSLEPDPRRPLLKLYQYNSWYLVIVLFTIGISLLLIGVLYDSPQLYDLSILGGYLLAGLLIRIPTEIFWRYPILLSRKANFIRWICGESQGGQAAMFLTGAMGWLQVGSWWDIIVRPNRFVHKTVDLSIAFQDPLYLPEYFVQSGAYVSTITSLRANSTSPTVITS